MSEDFLKNPLSLFDVRGKTAIVTGASGAFGALAAKVLAGAGCNLVLAAGGADALKTVAAECEGGDTGITVNAIAPTVFRSPLTAWMYEDNERSTTVRKGFIARVPKGRLGEPSDLAGPLLFLASKASDFYTGHILYADGGYTAG